MKAFKSRSAWLIALSSVLVLGAVAAMHGVPVWSWRGYWRHLGGGMVTTSPVTDVSDPRRLAGVTHNIFVGRVIAELGLNDRADIPETLFSVEVIENIKGDLASPATVNQQGGSVPGGLAPVVVDGDAALVVGKEYLFATRVGGGGAWHTLVPVYGDVPIGGPDERERIVAAYRQAVADEIPFDPSD